MGKDQFPDRLRKELLWRYHRHPRWWRRLCFWRMRRRREVLLESFRFVRPDHSETIYVPVGSVVDGASIPCFFYRIIGPPWGEYAEASVVHDWLWDQARRGKCSFDYANTIFLEAMEALDVARWRRRLMYWAVTLNAWRIQRNSR